MAKSSSRLSYGDCYELLDKALAGAKGSRIKVVDRSAAVHLRSRLHYARALDRADNEAVYPEGHQLRGRSPYDPLTVKIRKEPSGYWVYMVKSDQMQYQVEDIGEGDGIIQGSGSDHRETEVKEEDPPAAPVEEERRA